MMFKQSQNAFHPYYIGTDFRGSSFENSLRQSFPKAIGTENKAVRKIDYKCNIIKNNTALAHPVSLKGPARCGSPFRELEGVWCA